VHITQSRRTTKFVNPSFSLIDSEYEELSVHIFGLCRQVEVPYRRHNASERGEQRSARPGCECYVTPLFHSRTFEEVSQNNNFFGGDSEECRLLGCDAV
jgi:hypothetical protein